MRQGRTQKVVAEENSSSQEERESLFKSAIKANPLRGCAAKCSTAFARWQCKLRVFTGNNADRRLPGCDGAAVVPAGLLRRESARGGRAELGLVLYFNCPVLHTLAQ